MANKKLRVRALYQIRYIYKIGIFKYLVISLSMFFAQMEYEVKWKGRCVHLRKGTSDLVVFKQVMVFDQYALKNMKSKDMETIVDLGANIGLSAIGFSLRYPQATIIAIEPERKNYDLLVKNVADRKNIYCLHNAVWNSHRELSIRDQGLGEYGYMVGEQESDELSKVEAITIDEIMHRFNIDKIDLLKIDIEGSEKELFASNYESWLPRVKRIAIELHDWYRPGCASTFFRALSSYDYVMSVKGEVFTVLFDQKTKDVVYG